MQNEGSSRDVAAWPVRGTPAAVRYSCARTIASRVNPRKKHESGARNLKPPCAGSAHRSLPQDWVPGDLAQIISKGKELGAQDLGHCPHDWTEIVDGFTGLAKSFFAVPLLRSQREGYVRSNSTQSKAIGLVTWPFAREKSILLPYKAPKLDLVRGSQNCSWQDGWLSKGSRSRSFRGDGSNLNIAVSSWYASAQ